MRDLLIRCLLTAVMLLGLPLAGIALSGQSLQSYLKFPPLTRHVTHAPFSWLAFGIIATLDLLMLAGVVTLFICGRNSAVKKTFRPERPFPLLGWLGVAIMLTGWLLAWTRISWFAPLQHHTFCLPWAGFILLANAWCWQRSGTSLFHETPGRFLLLFPVSATFWWFFEFLNRVVQNWYYTGVDHFGPVAYTLFASLAFSTVLPAVFSTLRLLLTFPLFDQRLSASIPLKLPCPIFTAALILVISALSLALLSRFTDLLFPIVWVAPLLVITALQVLWQKPTIFAPLGRGDWRSFIGAATAALICGFFWELWNHHSLARWEYAIPYVNRFHLFAMPALGYGGYLPFGLECLLVGAIVMGNHNLGIGSKNR